MAVKVIRTRKVRRLPIRIPVDTYRVAELYSGDPKTGANKVRIQRVIEAYLKSQAFDNDLYRECST